VFWLLRTIRHKDQERMAFHNLQKIKSIKVLAGLLLFFTVLEIAFYGLLYFCPQVHKTESVVRLNAWMCLFLLSLCVVQFLINDSLFHLLTLYFQWFRKSSRLFKIHFLAAGAVLCIVMYLSTGTLSPYANTVDFPPDYPMVKPPCHYLFNGDYYEFSALFCLLDGKHRSTWKYSIFLRRILYNALAYPFMKIFEHDLGGLVFNFILTALAFLSLALFSLRTSGEYAAIAGMWLLALYPGVAYYGGQPFLYAFIVPGCLWLYMLLWKLNKYTSISNVWIASLGMSVLFLGYDLIVYFGPAALMLLVFRKKYVQVPVLVSGMLLLTTLWWCMVHFGLNVSSSNENSSLYSIILKSYFQPIDCSRWLELLKNLPENLFYNYFFSSFFFLPILFVTGCIITVCTRRKLLTLPETCLLAAVAIVFLFNNCAPPYDYKWQMRGTWIARLYQPMFVALLFSCARLFQAIAIEKRTRGLKIVMIVLLFVTVSGNGLVALGPALNDPAGISSWVYWNFYKHSPRQTMNINLAKYGRRPWGFCR
jgi:hypothetical protein